MITKEQVDRACALSTTGRQNDPKYRAKILAILTAAEPLPADMERILANNLDSFLDGKPQPAATGITDEQVIAGVRDTLIVAANNPVSHGGLRGLCGLMKTLAERLAALPQPAAGKFCAHCGCKLATNFGGREEHKADCPELPL